MGGVNSKIIVLVVLSNIIIIILAYLLCRSKIYSSNNKIILFRNMYLELMAEVVRTEVYTGARSLTMITPDRISNVRVLIEIIIEKHIKGDIVECGTWRGGVMAFARSVLNVYNERNRAVHLFDTFTGFPCLPYSKYSYERTWCKDKEMNDNSLDLVKKSFSKLKLLDGVKFYKGFFNNTIKENMFNRIALLRLDADSYENTMFLLEKLYKKVEKNGYVIIDDYSDWASCKKAVSYYRNKYKIFSQINTLPSGAIYWQKK